MEVGGKQEHGVLKANTRKAFHKGERLRPILPMAGLTQGLEHKKLVTAAWRLYKPNERDLKIKLEGERATIIFPLFICTRPMGSCYRRYGGGN